MTDGRRGWLATGAVSLLAVLHALRYRGHFSDDGFISLRYADRLATGHGLSWTAGEAVEGYSDLLWVVVIALGRLAGLPGIMVARGLGLLGLVLAVVAVSRSRVHRAISGGLLVALCGGAAAWAVGGLEQTLLAGLVACLVVGARDQRSWAVGLAPLTTWLRADALVLVLAVAVVFRRPRVAVAGLVAAVAQLGLRLVVHGDWIPNTARAKVSLDPGRAAQGVQWVIEGLVHNGVLVGLGLFAAVMSARARKPVVVALVGCVSVALVGGDLFNGYRQLVPILPLFALAFADAVEEHDWRWGPVAAGLYGVSNLFLAPVTALTEPGWALAGRAHGEVLREAFASRDPLLAVDAAGVLPWSTGFRSVDLLGLNDRYLAMHPPTDWGGAANLGHDLGEGTYAASRRPDLVVFCHALGQATPCFRSGREWTLAADWAAYEPLFIATRAGTATVYVRRDGVLGLQNDEPPSWWGSSAEHPARLVDGELVVRSPAQP